MTPWISRPSGVCCRRLRWFERGVVQPEVPGGQRWPDHTARQTSSPSPKGAAPCRASARTFSPDLFTGTGNFTVPIALPPGRNGFQPAAESRLQHRQRQRTVRAGLEPERPRRARKTSRACRAIGTRRPEERDTFMLSGAEDLVPVDGACAGESATVRAPRDCSPASSISATRATNYWEVGQQGRPGQLLRRDPTRPARRRPGGRRAIRDRDRANLRLEPDPDPRPVRQPHRVRVRTRPAVSETGAGDWDQLYLQPHPVRRLHDAGTGQERFLVSVTSSTSPARKPDPFSEYRAGFEIRTRKRCKRIGVAHARRRGPTWCGRTSSRISTIRPDSGPTISTQRRVAAQPDSSHRP